MTSKRLIAELHAAGYDMVGRFWNEVGLLISLPAEECIEYLYLNFYSGGYGASFASRGRTCH